MKLLTYLYKIHAPTTLGDSLLVVTDSRERALLFWKAFERGEGYKESWIDVGVKKFTSSNMETLP